MLSDAFIPLFGGSSTHQLGRHRLVASADQHDRIHRLGADHLLRVHSHEVAEHHVGRAEEHLAERHRGKGQRQRSSSQHTPRHRIDQLRHIAMAIIEAGRRHRDANDRFVQKLRQDARRPRERAAQITGEIQIPVIGRAAAKTL